MISSLATLFSFGAAIFGALGIIIDEGARCFPPAKTPDGAKIFGESAADWWDDILEIFGGVGVFSYNNRPVFKLFPLPGPGNTCVYASLYPDSSTGHAWSIGFYSGTCDTPSGEPG